MENFDRYDKWYSKFDKDYKWYYKWKNLINDIPNGKVW